jgi:hypothetical protein
MKITLSLSALVVSLLVLLTLRRLQLETWLATRLTIVHQSTRLIHHPATNNKPPAYSYENDFPCSSEKLRATYSKVSFTPILKLYNVSTKNTTNSNDTSDFSPCALVKLSCRLWSNIPGDIQYKDIDGNRLRVPVYDTAWGEILSATIMNLSPLAQQTMVPTGGIVIDSRNNPLFQQMLSQDEGLLRLEIPSTCMWEGGVLKGAWLKFIPDLNAIDISSVVAFGGLPKQSQLAVAVTWILDALALNGDRSASFQNLFGNVENALIVPLDFEQVFKIFHPYARQYAGCTAEDDVAAEQAIIDFMRKPAFMRKHEKKVEDLLCLDDGLKPVLLYVIQMIDDICGQHIEEEYKDYSNNSKTPATTANHSSCDALVPKLIAALHGDPWWQHEVEMLSRMKDSGNGVMMGEPMCCDKTFWSAMHTCKRCSDVSKYGWQHALDVRLRNKCSEMAGGSVVDYIVSVVAKRLHVVRKTAVAMLDECRQV